jgi:hypothetical protein
MSDREQERSARNRDLIARLSAPPTEAQILAEIDLEISDALDHAVAADIRSLVPLLRMTKLEVSRLRKWRKDKS